MNLSDEDFQRPQNSHAADGLRFVHVAADHRRTPEELPCLPDRQSRGIGRKAKEMINESRRSVAHQQIHLTYTLEPSDIEHRHPLFRPPVHTISPDRPVDDGISAAEKSNPPPI